MNSRNERRMMVGAIILVIAGILTIGVAVVITHVATPLLAVIILAWGVQSVRNATNPLLAGMVTGGTYLLIAFAVYFTGQPVALWGMILANWLGEALARRKSQET